MNKKIKIRKTTHYTISLRDILKILCRELDLNETECHFQLHESSMVITRNFPSIELYEDKEGEEKC